MRVGIIGTGAIAAKHALAYQNIEYKIVACTNTTAAKGRQFAEAQGAEFVETVEELCAHPQVDYVDVCTLPNFRLRAVELCAQNKKHVLVEKPMAVDLATAKKMLSIADAAGIQVGVVSQHRFDDAVLFLKRALEAGRLGRILQADAYVKWHRSAAYYDRPGKGRWAVEGGGALINQAIHQVDLLLYLFGSIHEVFGYWHLGSVHSIESEDAVHALLRYASGATGVLQAATAFWPGYPERIEIHGTKGTAVITGDRLTTWDIDQDAGEPAPVADQSFSGASNPMAISVTPFERQMLDFGQACREGRPQACSGIDGFRALQLVQSVYQSCREGSPVEIQNSI